MKKKCAKLIVVLMCVVCFCCGCGEKYTCDRCGATTKEAYYDMSDNYMCKDCARKYYAPFPYESYKVD